MKFLVVILLFLCSSLNAQQLITGDIIDAESNEKIPFVNVLGPNKTGTLADIDGRFELQVKTTPVSLTFSVLGYESKVVTVKESSRLTITLAKSAMNLGEVVILPTENPAWRIIRLASQNRSQNNPENGNTFSYNSYNKMFLTVDPEEPKLDGSSKPVNSTELDAERRFLDSNYLFFSETYATRNFISSNLDKEIITATKISGFKNPSFGMLASQFQSFTFYKDLITISSKAYLNPLTKNGENHYRFELIDTAYSNNDTVFIIRFEPKAGKNFDALKGQLHINTNGYAIQQVVAEPVVIIEGSFHAQIHQQYTMIGGLWFPEQLNTYLSLTSKSSSGSSNIVGEIRSYIKEIRLNPELKRKDASGIANDIAEGAGLKDSVFWEQSRAVELSQKEKNTYRFIDSLSEKEGLEKKFNLLGYLIDGQIPVGKASLVVTDFIKINNVEGTRLGLGMITNNRLSNYFAVGGAIGYGFKDKRTKYRGDAHVFLVKDNRLTLSFLYLNDLDEPGSNHFQRIKTGQAASESFRKLLVNRMDKIELFQLSIKAKLGNSITLEPFVNEELRTISGYDYQYASPLGEGLTLLQNQFVTKQIGVNIRWAPGEKLTRVFGHVLPQSTRYPIVQGRFINNGVLSNSGYPFNNLTVQIDHKVTVKLLGEVHYRVNAGYVDAAAPYPFLFNGRGNFAQTANTSYLRQVFTLNSFGGFETMRFNEFLSDRYVSTNIYYDLKSLLFKSDKFNPGIVLVGSALWGDSKFDARHRNIKYSVPRKGFFETGLMVNNLLKLNFSSIGLGFFYRLGAYSLPTVKENLAIKLNAVFNLD